MTVRAPHPGRIVYLDCVSGASGDMFLGALVDLGVSFDGLRSALATLPVPGYRLESARVQRCGFAATQVRVVLDGLLLPGSCQ